MSSNINPLEHHLPGLMEHLESCLGSIGALPEVDAGTLVRSFCRHHGIDPETVLAGAGTTQFIYALPIATGAERPLILGPTYADYADACRMWGRRPAFFLSTDAAGFEPDFTSLARRARAADLVFICNPNNPTGTLIPGEALAALCRRCSDTLFVIDESYLPFAPEGERESLLASTLANLVVLVSMSKIFKMPGLRLGFLKGPVAVIRRLKAYQLPWSVNTLAQAAGRYVLEQREPAERYVRETRNHVAAETAAFRQRIDGRRGLCAFPAAAGFVLVKLPPALTAATVCEALGNEKILLRDCTNFEGLTDRFVRVSLKGREANRRVAESLLSLCTESRPAPIRSGTRAGEGGSHGP